jgi:hypothetical protein
LDDRKWLNVAAVLMEGTAWQQCADLSRPAFFEVTLKPPFFGQLPA